MRIYSISGENTENFVLTLAKVCVIIFQNLGGNAEVIGSRKFTFFLRENMPNQFAKWYIFKSKIPNWAKYTLTEEHQIIKSYDNVCIFVKIFAKLENKFFN